MIIEEVRAAYRIFSVAGRYNNHWNVQDIENWANRQVLA